MDQAGRGTPPARGIDLVVLFPLATTSFRYYPISMKKTSTRGGAGRGQGRKPLREGDPTVIVSIKMTGTQKKKLARLGGAEWVRTRIDRAHEPADAAEEVGTSKTEPGR